MLAIAQLPYDRDLVYPSISMNYPLKMKGGVVNPDMTITITAVEEAPSVVLVPSVVECAVSEDRVHVFNKVENEIEAHLDTLLAIIVLVRKGINHACPEIDSAAWKELHNGDDDPQPLSLDSFVSQHATPQFFDAPIRIGGHDWCHVQSVEYFVWVKGDNQDRIDIRDNNPQFMAYRVSHVDARVLNLCDNLCRLWPPP